MDNKQKRKMYKIIYVFLSFIALVLFAYSIYISANYIDGKNYEGWPLIACIIINVVLFLTQIIDSVLTKKLKNKFNLFKVLFLFSVVPIIAYLGLYITFATELVPAKYTLKYIAVLPVLRFTSAGATVLLVNFIVGLNVSRLLQNTTITIDAVAETPTYNDELLLKKKLDELNRKLEIKKVQEQISKIEQELDNK